MVKDLQNAMAKDLRTRDPAPAFPIPHRPPTDDVIERWWVETFTNIGLDTELYGRFRAAANRLKDLIAETR
jgi:hypothetical protein